MCRDQVLADVGGEGYVHVRIEMRTLTQKRRVLLPEDKAADVPMLINTLWEEVRKSRGKP